MKKAKLVTLLTAILCSASGAYASTVYTYTGNPFTVSSGPLAGMFTEIDVSLTFDRPLLPSRTYFPGIPWPPPGDPVLLDWHASDGLLGFGPQFGGDLVCRLDTDSSGGIESWYVGVVFSGGWLEIDLETIPGLDQTAIYIPADPLDPMNSYAQISGASGTWTVEGGLVPEPGSFALVLAALATGLAWHRKRARG